MTNYSPDVIYAYVQLGLAPRASLERIQEVLENATAYRFSTRQRIEQVRRFSEFFVERSKFGTPEHSFSEIRKAYHKQVKALHPDQNKGDKATEDRLKAANAAYEIVDKIHREAKDYFHQSDAARRETEKEAKETTERETPAKARKETAKEQAKQDAKAESATRTAHADTGKHRKRTEPHSRPHSSIKYMAASVPRYIRTSRLFYLPLDAIIGSRLVKPKGSVGLMYDIIMLPEKEFLRARLYLGSEISSAPELNMSKMTPPYIPIDTKEIFIPAGEAKPYQYARDYFVKEFGLES